MTNELDISKVKVQDLAYFPEPLEAFIQEARNEYWFNDNPKRKSFNTSWTKYPTFEYYLATKFRAVAALLEMGWLLGGTEIPQP